MAIVESSTDKSTGKRRAARGTKTPEAAQRATSLTATPLAEMDKAARKEVLTLTGKDLASSLGAHILLRMLAETGKSMRQVADESGFDVSLLSRIANGKRTSGPELWTLVALAEAMDLDLTLDFAKR